MKKIFALLFVTLLAACHDNTPQQAQYQPQYQQPAPVVVQQAPAQAPVVVQQQDNSGTALVAGAALGALAVHALSDRDRGYGPGYNQQPAVQQNVTHVTQVNKTVVVNNNGKPDDKTPPAAVAPTRVPNAPAPTSVSLAKGVPAAKPNYAAPGTASPAPVASAAFLSVPKVITPSAAQVPAAAYKPNNFAAVGYKQPPSLPAPAPKPLALPAPKPAATSYGYSAPKAASYSYKPPSVSYNSSSNKKK